MDSYWFLLGLFLLALEMATGTFYLLVLAIATVAGGLIAWAGAGNAAQFIMCAVTAMVGVLMLRKWKSAAGRDRLDEGLDIGQPVKILVWHADGTARVLYRGAEWDAECAAGHEPHPASMQIAAVRGSVLVLQRTANHKE